MSVLSKMLSKHIPLICIIMVGVEKSYAQGKFLALAFHDKTHINKAISDMETNPISILDHLIERRLSNHPELAPKLETKEGLLSIVIGVGTSHNVLSLKKME